MWAANALAGHSILTTYTPGIVSCRSQMFYVLNSFADICGK